MITTHPLSNFLSTFNNALAIDKGVMKQPYSNSLHALVGLLLEMKIIKTFKISDDRRFLVLFLLKKENLYLSKLQQVSKKNRRVFVKLRTLQTMSEMYILATTAGLVSSKEAVRHRIGGEIIAKICSK